MEIKRVKLTEIRPYERNPRVNDHAVDAVAASIREFGWQQPIVVDSEGVIIAGHTRYKAAEKLKCMDVPVVVADKLTQDQVRAYRLADNKTGEKAEWDMELLEAELAELGDMDMGEFGFDDFSDDQRNEPEMPEIVGGDLDQYRYIHYLVTVETQEHDHFIPLIEQLKDMGAEVKETRNNT